MTTDAIRRSKYIPDLRDNSGHHLLSVVDGYLDAGAKALRDMNLTPLAEACDELIRALVEGGRVYVFGNGACAALANHMAADLRKVGVTSRRPASVVSAHRLKIISLAANTALISAIGNDLSFDDIFVEQVRGEITAGDVAIGLSASGASRNVLAALEYAAAVGAATIAFTGQLVQSPLILHTAQICLVVPSDRIDVVEDAHVVLHHMLTRMFAATPMPQDGS